MDRIFIDSGAFIAWLSADDKHHQSAVARFAKAVGQNAQLVTTNLIINETCTWLLRHAPQGHNKAVEYGKYIDKVSVATASTDILPHRGLFVLYSTPELEKLAWQIFGKYDAAGFSFTDCVSFAAMQTLGLKKAFAFDAHFDVMGFERL